VFMCWAEKPGEGKTARNKRGKEEQESIMKNQSERGQMRCFSLGARATKTASDRLSAKQTQVVAEGKQKKERSSVATTIRNAATFSSQVPRQQVGDTQKDGGTVISALKKNNVETSKK